MYIDVDIWFRRLSFFLSRVEKGKTSANVEEVNKCLNLKDVGGEEEVAVSEFSGAECRSVEASRHLLLGSNCSPMKLCGDRCRVFSFA